MHNLGYFMYYTHSWLNNSILKLCFEETNIIKIWRRFVDLKGQFLLKPPYCHLLCWPMMKIFVSVFYACPTICPMIEIVDSLFVIHVLLAL